MKSRCYNPNDQHYKWYGGKGVTICDEWLSENGVQSFIEWALNNGYEENLSIDRIDSNKPYEPQNCRWITQALNSSLAHRTENTVYTDFRELREQTGLSQQKFGDYFKIPRRTIQNWEIGVSECNQYIIDLMAYKLKNEGIIK
jgi:DNA-binding transcriptional regulator YiaG